MPIGKYQVLKRMS